MLQESVMTFQQYLESECEPSPYTDLTEDWSF